MNKIKNKKIIYNEGQIMIGIVVMFIVISLSVTTGLAWNAQKELSSENNVYSSAKSYYSSEAITEDVVYRIKKGMQVSTTETININDAIGTATISDISGGKLVNSSGDYKNSIRKTSVSLSQGVGVSFHYGIQSGQGGFEIEGGSTINGNVYVNGNIEGDGGATITGSATAANSAPISASVSNTSPSTPPSNIIFGNSSSNQDFAQSFQVSETGNLNKIKFYAKRTSNSPSGSLTVRISSDAGGKPSTNTIDSVSIAASSLPTSFNGAWTEVVFPNYIQFQPGVTYWVVFDGGNNSSKYFTMATNTYFLSFKGMTGQFGTTSWNETSPNGLDAYIEIYTGGITATISGDGYDYLRIGTTGGDAWAHTVNSTNTYGLIYCQAGTMNNGKICDTSRQDPSPQAFPVSDNDLQIWKDEAVAGGTITGNYSVGWAGATLGPKKITGNLTVSGGGTLTVTGTLWVQGNITVTGGGKVRLAPSYGANSGVILQSGTSDVQGYISISGAGMFSGSGEVGSYPMVVTTSVCPAHSSCGGNNAISMSGGAGAVILNAQNGTLLMSGGTSARTMTAYKTIVTGGGVVNYEAGLVNLNFSSGPSGGFDINGWTEIE